MKNTVNELKNDDNSNKLTYFVTLLEIFYELLCKVDSVE